MDHRDEIEDLLGRAESMGHGPAQFALADEAVRLADSHQDIEAGYFARQEYIKAALFSGQPEKMLVAFSWCLGQFDRDPERFDAHRLLWQYKWVANALPDFPQIERRQIDEMFDDMAKRFRTFGASEHAVWHKRRGVALKMGEPDAMRRAHVKLAGLKRDDLSDCHACEMDEVIDYQVFLGDDRAALDAARPILQGRYSCSEVPQVTYAKVLLPLLRLRRGPDAMQHHVRGYRMIAKNPAEFIVQIADHIGFLALTGNYPRGLRLLEKHLNLALETACPAYAFEMYLSLTLLMDRLAAAKMITIRTRMPESFPARNESGEYEVKALYEWFADQASDLAAKFDARNGNEYHRQRVKELAELPRYAARVPVPSAG